MRLSRATFMATTEVKTRRHHRISQGDHRCCTHWLMVTQHRKASDMFANEEQAGNIARISEPSAKRTILPTRSVPSSHPTNNASIFKIKLEKHSKNRRLQSIGTVVVRMITAPRRREEVALVNRSMWRLSAVRANQLNATIGRTTRTSETAPTTKSTGRISSVLSRRINDTPAAQAMKTITLISKLLKTASAHPSWLTD